MRRPRDEKKKSKALFPFTCAVASFEPLSLFFVTTRQRFSFVGARACGIYHRSLIWKVDDVPKAKVCPQKKSVTQTSLWCAPTETKKKQRKLFSFRCTPACGRRQDGRLFFWEHCVTTGIYRGCLFWKYVLIAKGNGREKRYFRFFFCRSVLRVVQRDGKKGCLVFFVLCARRRRCVALFFFDRSRWREKGGRDWCGRPSFFYLVDFRKIFGRMGSHAV